MITSHMTEAGERDYIRVNRCAGPRHGTRPRDGWDQNRASRSVTPLLAQAGIRRLRLGERRQPYRMNVPKESFMPSRHLRLDDVNAPGAAP